jgi:hypothetical protein
VAAALGGRGPDPAALVIVPALAVTAFASLSPAGIGVTSGAVAIVLHQRADLDAVAERGGADPEQEQSEGDADRGALDRGGRSAGPAEIGPEGERRRAQRECHQHLTRGHLVSRRVTVPYRLYLYRPDVMGT